LTVSVIIIGSYGGTTVVIIKIHLKNSFSLLLYSFSIPWSNTYAEVINEHINKNKTIHNPSFSKSFKFYALATTLRINFPFEVSKPVARTKPRHPLFGS
jgi:hypothetical protein